MIFADVVWPSMFLTGRLFAWWIIVAGLVIEWGFVLRLTQTTLLRAGIMTLVMNTVSAGVGILAIPVSGLLWEFVAMVTVQPLFHWGTFNPITWFVSCILAAFLNTIIETASLRLIFKVAWTKRLFWSLTLT